ncbi:hypothetical protein [Flavobacterium sp. LC2016-12]|uniref:hypothetical protein n=1 Tax=Flavobacterium sp. LC2016-12 TaxID=2783794 RepID=UPI00188DB588|nr:hypothetical protein [Flavobacterium sp. LC2016-12]MBF4465410.1 hypothetical protein [Flavobacterium sp. LC2016-12]
MKTLFTLGACALLSLTIFSCTSDDFENESKGKTTIVVEKDTTETTYATGPDDDPIEVPVPPVKKP